MDFATVNQELFRFLDHSPNAFFAVRNMCEKLDRAGMIRLFEGRPWTLEAGKGYYVTRNDSALIAFRIPRADYTGFQIMASHCDSPVFKIKTNAEITVDDRYVKLNVEKYGGMLCAPWLDRPLSVAGRIMVRTNEGIETKLVNVDRSLLIIPNLAIHMNREVNDGYSYNAQVDMLPLFCEKGEEKDTRRIFWIQISSCTIVCPPKAWACGVSSSPAAAWTTCSARLPPCRDFSRPGPGILWPSTAFLTMKKSAPAANRVPRAPSSAIHCAGSTGSWAGPKKTTL